MSRRDILVAALIISIIAHVALMFWARPKVMTSVAHGIVHVTRRVNTAARQEIPEGNLTEMSLVEDEEAKKDAPEINDEEVLKLSAMSAMSTLPLSEDAQVEVSPSEVPPEFEHMKIIEAPVEFASAPVVYVPPPPTEVKAEIETPTVAPAPVEAPKMEIVAQIEVQEPTVGPTEETFTELDDELTSGEPEKLVQEGNGEDFEVAENVLPDVDEKFVESEKQAVKELIDSYDALEMTSVADVSLVKEYRDGWTYFQIKVVPKPDLPIVPKDIVILVDTSPSVGRDRLASVKDAIKRLLVNGTNTGDRFNIVAFSDKFQYGFNSWQDCETASFDHAERWLDSRVLHGWTDVFAVIRSVLTLPRDPKRPLIALVVTDGEANKGISETAQILSRFSELNDGLISVYMYGVKSAANAELIDVLTRGNRGESMIYREGFLRDRADAGKEIDKFAQRFQMPVVTDLRLVFAADVNAEAYPTRMKNLYRGNTVEVVGRVKGMPNEINFSLKGLAGEKAYESFYKFPLKNARNVSNIAYAYQSEVDVERKTR